VSSLEVQIHELLARRAGASVPSSEEIAELVRQGDPLRPPSAVDRSVAAIQARLRGLGPLEPLLVDPEVSDVLVNGPGPVWVERSGTLEQTDVVLGADQVDLLVERIVAPLGRRADPVHALVDGRLADGSRVHVVVPPLAVDGPCIAIRRFTVRPVALADFAMAEVAELLRWAVTSQANLVVSGATGSGKTTLLNALARLISPADRIVTVEDAAELRLGHDHVVRLESRPPSPDGGFEVTIRDLVRSALRMRPDRIIVGEVRGPEAFDLLAAMSTGHDGALSTVHANSAADALERLQTLVLQAGVGLPFAAVGRQLGAALDLVVHVERTETGGRVVSQVAEVRAGIDGAGPSARLIADRSGLLAAPIRPPRRHGADAPPVPTP